MANLPSLTVNDTGFLTLPNGNSTQRTVGGRTVVSFTSTGATTWTAPTNVTSIQLLVVAGGGGGGGAISSGSGAGGGAGGLQFRSNYPVIPGNAYSVVVGAGGSGGNGPSGLQGAPGGNSLFGLGTNLVTNGDFTSNVSGWTDPGAGAEGSFTWSSGVGVLASTNATDPPPTVYQAITCVVGNTYLVTATKTAGNAYGVVNIVTGVTTGGGSGGFGNVIFFNNQISTGTLTGTFTATQTSYYIFLRMNENTSGVSISFDNVGVYDISSNVIAIGGGPGGNTYIASAASTTGGWGGSGGGGGVVLSGSEQLNFGTGLAGQGYNGGSGSQGGGYDTCGGGGGAGGPASNGFQNIIGGGGGPGLYFSQFSSYGASGWFSGGGAGGTQSNSYPGQPGKSGAQVNSSAAANTGGGGGGGSGASAAGGAGGSGVVLISYVTNDAFGQMRYNTDSNQVEAYSDVQGWLPKDQTYNEATGGNIAAFGGWKYHYFNTSNSPATFVPKHTGLVDLMVVAGGGGGGGNPTAGAGMSGGGAGGVIYSPQYQVIAGQSYAVTVGAGGAGGTGSPTYNSGFNGNNSTFGNLVAIGGGRGGGYGNSGVANPSYAGGSGGGGGTREPSSYLGESYIGSGVTGQGNKGGVGIPGSPWCSAGGGGAGSVGGNASGSSGGSGGDGILTYITGTARYYGGGGGGSSYNTGVGDGGRGGGGMGVLGNGSVGVPGTGGGGGGGGTVGSYNSGAGGAGGSGIVIVRYRTPTIGDGSTSATAAPSAKEIKKQTGTTTDGLYWIMVPNVGAVQVYCDMNTDGGGWMHAGTFNDDGTTTNSANQVWGINLDADTRDTGLWQNYSTLGSQSFTANFKSAIWAYAPFTQMLMKDQGATLRNIWRTKVDNTTNYGPGYDSLSWFWSQRKWLADGSDTGAAAISAGRVFYANVTNYGNSDPVFGANTQILFKYGERYGVQDTNRDRAMISVSTAVDSPLGIGCSTNLGGPLYYRNIVPAANAADNPPASITGAPLNYTLWIR